ncbi:hypothetical protein VE03_10637, partial [Pseudogymnoascus sp. 23342-1-I1]
MSTHCQSREEQTSTRQIQGELFLRKTLSIDNPTYDNFVVNLEPHRAAVQITTTPFAIRTFPGQTFYSSKYRYTLCCSAANPTAISQAVQRTYDINYRLVKWDFSNESWNLTVIERIALLIHIIHMVVRQDADKTEHLKTITVKKLQNAAESAT